MKEKTIRFGGLLGANRGEPKGRIAGLPLSADVEILLDDHGVPHIYAETDSDLYVAQGFLHAKDRLWQLETLRRFASSRLAEVGGPEMADVDHFSLLAGFGQMRDRAIADATEAEREILTSYVNGINAYIRWAGKRIPLEFRNLKMRPAEWCLEDLCGVLPFTSWSLQTNYEQELLAILARKQLDADLFNELYPVGPEERLERESFFEKFRDVRIAPLLPAAFSLYPGMQGRYTEGVANPAFGGSPGGAVSNCWVVADGAEGAPLLANDPHLGVMLPQVWHLCHLHTPNTNVAGVSMLGFPGVILGRNERVAWGATNVMTDIVDLYIVRIDKSEPTHYYIGEKRHEMQRDVALIPVAGGEPREVVIYRTLHGTVISRVEKGYEAVVVLKWYGTHDAATIEDRTIGCFLSLMGAKTADEAIAFGEQMKTAGQNLTAADVDGTIAWRATGLVPLRKGYSGRVPADGSNPAVGWVGFLPYDQMPSSRNPASKRIVTANNRTTNADHDHPITYSWLANYRHDRIDELIAESPQKSVEQMAEIQMDVHSLQAERLLPRLLSFEFIRPSARLAADILRSWDQESVPDSEGPTVFSVFLTELKRLLAAPLLGEALPLFLATSGFFYTPVDRLLTGAKPERLLAAAGFTGETAVQDACEEALCRAVDFLTRYMGSQPVTWKWGELHTYLYQHPGATSRLTGFLLNRGPYPAYGDSTTVNVSAFDASLPGDAVTKYRTITIASMRLVTSLHDIDSTIIVAPLGQSGRPGNRHYDDFVDDWISGRRTMLPLSREAAEAVAKETLILGR